jgi:hypothetical protein
VHVSEGLVKMLKSDLFHYKGRFVYSEVTHMYITSESDSLQRHYFCPEDGGDTFLTASQSRTPLHT